MKKTNILLLLSSAFLLFSCGGNQDKTIVPEGESVPVETVKAKYQAAASSMEQEKKGYSVKVDGARFDVSATLKVVSPIEDSGEPVTVSDASVHASITDFSLSAAVAEKEGGKIGAHAKTSFASDIGVEVKSDVPEMSVPNVSHKGNVSASFYLQDNAIYLDSSGLSELLKGLNSSQISFAEKTKIALSGDDAAEMPDVEWGQIPNELEKFCKDTATAIVSKDGTYSFVYHLDFPTLITSIAGEGNSWGAFAAALEFGKDSYAEASLSFNENGLTRFAVGYSVKASFSQNDPTGVSAQGSFSSSANFVAEFAFGVDNVESVPDPDSYVLAPAN